MRTPFVDTVTCSWYVPVHTRIRSPGAAASTAAWMLVNCALGHWAPSSSTSKPAPDGETAERREGRFSRGVGASWRQLKNAAVARRRGRQRLVLIVSSSGRRGGRAALTVISRCTSHATDGA